MCHVNELVLKGIKRKYKTNINDIYFISIIIRLFIMEFTENLSFS